MFDFWDGLKMRMLALVAMLLTAGTPAATVASAHVPTTNKTTQTTIIAQTDTQNAGTQTQTNTTPTTPAPATTPAPVTPPPTDPQPGQFRTCGCGRFHIPKGYVCALYCRDQAD